MPRFFKENFKQAPFIDGADAVHISRSLRMRVGEKLVVCDSKGNDFNCVITGVAADRVDLEIKEELQTQSEPDVKLTLCTALLKGDKFEYVIRHSVELGVSEITPFFSDNCVSRPDARSILGKISRWQKISDEAAGQSGRGILPKINPAITLKELAEGFADFDLVLFFYECGGCALGKIMCENVGVKKIAIITGPEGGFSKSEADMLVSAGAKVISLGKRILRAETAPLAAVTGVMLLTDNLE